MNKNHLKQFAGIGKTIVYRRKMSHDPHSSLNELRNNMYFGTEVVNRVSFLREDCEFISASILHPSTRFIFFYRTDPLINKNSNNKLVILTNGDNQIIDDSKVNGDGEYKIIRQGLNKYDLWNKAVAGWIDDNKNQSSTIRDRGKPGFLLLGLVDESVGLKLSNLKFEENPDFPTDDERYLDYQGRYQGIPYFAVDLSHASEISELVINHVKQELKKIDKTDLQEVFYTYSRKHYLSFPHKEAALFSHGKMYFDWLNRNRFCPGCGSKVIPINAGGKIYCINQEKATKDKYVCPIKNTSVSNVSFPRTDSVIITAITNTTRDKLLLSLSKRHATTKMWSCTAGFMEPSETVEVATKREIWEETGVTCNDIKIVMTQPWPFPGNLMIGCIATVEFNGKNEIIDLDHDGELSDAKWFDISTIKKLANNEETEFDMILPMSESIAFSLIKLVLQGDSESSYQKDNKL